LDAVSEVPAARHTLQIVKYLAGHSGPVRASTIARDLDLPRSTTYHLLRVLQDEGFLVHSPEHQAFGLSALVADIGTSVRSADTLARLAHPVLERLIAETKLPVVAHLGVLNHRDVVYASKVSAARAPAVITSIGVRLPAHLTATGRAMLAALPASHIEAIYPRDDSLHTRRGPGPTTLEQLTALLDDARERHWATEDGDITLEYASVAAAVLDHNGYPAAAVGLTFRGSAIGDREWVLLGRATANAAEALSRRIRGKS
jgi:DNA-binding IclR family transcriptional regulator